MKCSSSTQTEPLCSKCNWCDCGKNEKEEGAMGNVVFPEISPQIHSHQEDKFPSLCEEIVFYDGQYLPLVNGIPIRVGEE